MVFRECRYLHVKSRCGGRESFSGLNLSSCHKALGLNWGIILSNQELFSNLMSHFAVPKTKL